MFDALKDDKSIYSENQEQDIFYVLVLFYIMIVDIDRLNGPTPDSSVETDSD